MKPGLTGPMQVYGRGQLTFDERLAVEREYIENLSLRRDLRILALTLSAVVGGGGLLTPLVARRRVAAATAE